MAEAEQARGPRTLSDDELAAEEALALPDREAMSLMRILPYPDPHSGLILDPPPDYADGPPPDRTANPLPVDPVES